MTTVLTRISEIKQKEGFDVWNIKRNGKGRKGDKQRRAASLGHIGTKPGILIPSKIFARNSPQPIPAAHATYWTGTAG
jgi:hypothetical protein